MTTHRTSTSLVPIAAVLLAACGSDPAEPELLLPDEVGIAWEDVYNGIDDGLGALVPVDVMAYDGASGEPLANVPIQVWTDDVAAIPLPVEAVLVMNPPEALSVGPDSVEVFGTGEVDDAATSEADPGVEEAAE